MVTNGRYKLPTVLIGYEIIHLFLSLKHLNILFRNYNLIKLHNYVPYSTLIHKNIEREK